MANYEIPHTDSKGRGLCLKYRHGKRCRRVAKYMVKYSDNQGIHVYPVCKDCMDEVTSRLNGRILEYKADGFMVRTGTFCRSRIYEGAHNDW